MKFHHNLLYDDSQVIQAIVKLFKLQFSLTVHEDDTCFDDLTGLVWGSNIIENSQVFIDTNKAMYFTSPLNCL